MRRVVIAVAILTALGSMAVLAHPTARPAAQSADAGPGQSAPAPMSVVVPGGPRQTLTSRMVMVGRADAESERVTTSLSFEAGSAELVERTDIGPTMFIGGGDRNPKRWKPSKVRRLSGTTAIEGGYLRFHLVGAGDRKLELTCMTDSVDALARKVVATETKCSVCGCETVWDPPQTTPVSGLYCFDPGGVTFQQFFSASKVDYIYENDACTRGDGYRLR